MTRILVVYYSAHGHTERMARAVVDGAASIANAKVDLRRVPDTSGADKPSETAAPVAEIDELPQYDAILFGTPTRYGNMCGQMRMFLDRTGKLWSEGALVGKVGSVFASTATQHGGQESTILSFHTTLLHLGFVIVGLPYSCTAQMGVDEIKGGSPYGASTIADGDGKRMPSAQELEMARFQGRHVAQITAALRSGREMQS